MVNRKTLALGAAGLGLALMIVAGREWAVGTVNDAAMGQAVVSATGLDAARVVAATGLVAAAAGLAAVLSGRVGRWVSVAIMGLASLIALVGAVGVLLDPAGAVATQAGEALGRTGAVDATGEASHWVWVAVVLAAMLALLAVGAAVSIRSWPGASSRYERPATGQDGAHEERGQRADPADTWDRLSRGDDPT